MLTWKIFGIILLLVAYLIYKNYLSFIPKEIGKQINNQLKKDFENPTKIIKKATTKNHIKPLEFNEYIDKWSHDEFKDSSEFEYPEINELRFITYNIWFDNHNWSNRVKEILQIIQKHSPDFICLQEVTQKFMSKLIADKNIQKNYIISGNKINYYDVLFLYKKKLRRAVNIYAINYPTRMERKLLLAELIIKVGKLYQTVLIGTSHFESLYPNFEYRNRQLKIAFDTINKSDNSFLMGDFNFDPIVNYEEEKAINYDIYTDSWLEYVKIKNLTGEEAKGLTFPKEDDIPPTRLDRIYYSKKGVFKLKQMNIIGNEPIDLDRDIYKEYDINTPSDHKGLYAEFELK